MYTRKLVKLLLTASSIAFLIGTSSIVYATTQHPPAEEMNKEAVKKEETGTKEKEAVKKEEKGTKEKEAKTHKNLHFRAHEKKAMTPKSKEMKAQNKKGLEKKIEEFKGGIKTPESPKSELPGVTAPGVTAPITK